MCHECIYAICDASNNNAPDDDAPDNAMLQTMLQYHVEENKTNRHETRLNDDTTNYFCDLERITALTFELLMLIARAPTT